MEPLGSYPDGQKKKMLMIENGKIYFSKDLERKFFLVLTIALLLSGLMYKIGVLQ
jgi:hypothetical protein